MNASYKGYSGAVFDGRYIYYVPCIGNIGYHGFIVRYDTTTAFSGGTYNVYDVASNVNPNCKGFKGAVFDGRYIYLYQIIIVTLV